MPRDLLGGFRRTFGGRRRQPVGQRTPRAGDDRARLRNRRRVGAAEPEPELLPLARAKAERRRDLEDGMRAAVEAMGGLAIGRAEPLERERRGRADDERSGRGGSEPLGRREARGRRTDVVGHRGLGPAPPEIRALEEVQEARPEPPLLDVLDGARPAAPREAELHAHEHPRHVAFGTQDGADHREPVARVLDLEPRRAERPPRRPLAGALREVAAPGRTCIVQDRDTGALRLRRRRPEPSPSSNSATVPSFAPCNRMVPLPTMIQFRRVGGDRNGFHSAAGSAS